MSWICPHQINDFCKRLSKACEPGTRGCELGGEVEFIDFGEENKTMVEKVTILDLRPMPPFERHEKIFALWDTLKPGEALKIINDHDPRPLWYQFEVEYKDKYEWAYEQKGPKDWIVQIKRR